MGYKLWVGLKRGTKTEIQLALEYQIILTLFLVHWGLLYFLTCLLHLLVPSLMPSSSGTAVTLLPHPFLLSLGTPSLSSPGNYSPVISLCITMFASHFLVTPLIPSSFGLNIYISQRTIKMFPKSSSLREMLPSFYQQALITSIFYMFCLSLLLVRPSKLLHTACLQTAVTNSGCNTTLYLKALES